MEDLGEIPSVIHTNENIQTQTDLRSQIGEEEWIDKKEWNRKSRIKKEQSTMKSIKPYNRSARFGEMKRALTTIKSNDIKPFYYDPTDEEDTNDALKDKDHHGEEKEGHAHGHDHHGEDDKGHSHEHDHHKEKKGHHAHEHEHKKVGFDDDRLDSSPLEIRSTHSFFVSSGSP